MSDVKTNGNPSYPFEDSDFKASEDAAIRIRRAKAELGTSESTSNRIGWACSAGGIRSSIFSYGVLQAFAHHGLLKHIDYMTGVSGGGFTVAHMAAKGAERELSKEFIGGWGADKNTGKLNKDCMTRIPVGSYLSDRLSAIGRYLFHTQFVLAFSLGLLITTATAVAMFYRLFDQEMVRARLDFSGISLRSVDLAAAFVPTWIVLFWTFPGLFVVFASNWTAKKRQLAWEAAIKGIDLTRYFIPVQFLAYLLAFAIFSIWLTAILLFHFEVHRSWLPMKWKQGGDALQECLAGASIAMTLLMPWLLAIGQRLRTKPNNELENWPIWLRGLVVSAFVTSFCGLMALTFGREPIVYILSPGFTFAICLVFGEERWRSYSSYFRIVLVAMTLAIVSSAMIFQGNGIGTIGGGSSPIDVMASGWLKFVAIVGGIVQLTVMFGLGSVIQSEQDDTQTWKRYAFSAALSVLTIVPFALAVMIIGRENVSGFASHRDADLLRDDIKSWDLLEAVINDIAVSETTVSNMPKFLEKIDTAVKQAHESAKVTDNRLDEGREMTWKQYQNTGFYRGKLLGALHFCGLQGRTEWDDYKTKYETSRAAEDQAVKLLNSMLNSDELSKRLGYLVIQEAISKDNGKSPTEQGLLLPSQQNEVEKWFIDQSNQLNEKETGIAIWTWIGDRKSDQTDLLCIDPQNRKLVGKLSELREHQRTGYNRFMLELLYPSIIKARNAVSTPTVRVADQQFRWILFFASLGGTLFFGLISANWTPAFFHVYCERLQTYFLQISDGSRRLRVRSCRTWQKGLPIPLWVATASWRYTNGDFNMMKQEPYVFSPFGGYIVDAENQQLRGGHAYNLLKKDHENIKIDYSSTTRSQAMQFHEMPQLSTVAGISGSAFNAFVPTHPLLRGVMFALNLQLGQWVRMPAPKLDSKTSGERVDSELASAESVPTGFGRETIQRMMSWCSGKLTYHLEVAQLVLQAISAVRVMLGSSELPRRVFTADGGFCDGLGIEELLRRKCRLIIVSDGSFQGGVHYMQELGRAIRQAQVRSGVQFLELDEDRPVDLNRLDRGQSANVPQRFMLCRIRYPEPIDGEASVAGLASNEAIFVYMLMSMSGVESAPLQRMRAKSPSFPDEPTANQTFSEEQTDCYRLLGYEIGASVAKFLNEDDSKTIHFAALIERLRLAYYEEVFQERGIIGDVTAAVLGQQAIRCVAVQWQIDCDAPSDHSSDALHPLNRCLKKIDDWLDPLLDNSLEIVMERWFTDTNFRMHVIAQVWLQISGHVGSASSLGASGDVLRRMQALLLLHALAVKELMLWDELPLRIGQKQGRESFVGALNTTVQNTSVSKQRSSAMLRVGGARELCNWARSFAPEDIHRIARGFTHPNSWAEAMWDLDFLAGTTAGRQSLNIDEQSKFNDEQRFLLSVEETVFPFAGRRIALLACICADNRLRYQSAEATLEQHVSG